MTSDTTIDQFKEKASLVSAVVHEVADSDAALQKAVSLAAQRAPRMDLMGGASSGQADAFEKIVAAPNLSERDADTLEKRLKDAGIRLVKEGIRRYPGGIDMGITRIDYGIAETGTLVLNSNSEETRLATMLAEVHVAILPKALIRPTALSLTAELKEMQSTPGSYTAFITGASRTADIERVLALGVHGPLELHIMLLED